MITTDLTKKEKFLLWISRIFGVLLSGALAALVVLFYMKYINTTMFVLASLGLGCVIVLLAALNFNIKSTKFFTFFSFTLAFLLAIAFCLAFAIFIQDGSIVFSK